MADFELAKIATWDFYDLWSADVANISGNFSHQFKFPTLTGPLALCTLSFHVESIAQITTDLEQMGVTWTGRVDNSNFKLWRRTSAVFLKTLDSQVSADLELGYPVEIRKGENFLVQSKAVDVYGSPTGDGVISVMTRPTWTTLTEDLKKLKNVSNRS